MVDILPDCRTRVPTNVVRAKNPSTGEEQNWIPTYCANCGKPEGFVSDTDVMDVFVLCNACVATHGEPAGLMKAGSQVFQEKIADATRGMTVAGVARDLDNPDSLLTKLANDFRRACGA